MAQSNFPALTVQQVQTAYLAFFNRPADSAGLAYWTSVQHKGGLPGMWSSFGLVPEFTATFGNRPATEIVETFYVNMFGRPSDAAGKTYWLAELSAGRVDIGNLAAAFDAGAAPADKTILSGKVVANTATTQAAIDAVLPGTTFLLTAGVDKGAAFAGTGKADTFIGSLTTVGDGDELDGGAGVDTLTLELIANVTDKFKSANIEKVVVSSIGDRSIDTKNFTGVESFTSKGSSGTLTLNNLASSTTGLGFDGTDAKIIANHLAGTLSGANDVLNVSMVSAKNAALTVLPGFESAKLSVTGANDFATFTVPGVKTILVEGGGSLNAKALFTSVFVLDTQKMVGALTTGSANETTGLAGDDITADTLGATILLGDGNNNIGFVNTGSTGVSTIKFGKGNDKLIFNAAGAGAVVVFGGDGDDTISAVTTALSVNDVIDGGAGNDTLFLAGGTVANNAMVLRSIENVTIAAGTGIQTFTNDNSASKITFVAADNSVVDLRDLSAGSTVTVNKATAFTGEMLNLAVGFKNVEAASTINVNAPLDGTIATSKIAAPTLKFNDVVKVGTTVSTTDATSLNIDATKSFERSTVNAADDKLTSVAITGADAVTVTDIGAAGTNKLETVSVTAAKALIVGTIGADGDLTKLKSVTLSSADSTLVVGHIGLATNAEALAVSINAKGNISGTNSIISTKIGDVSIVSTTGTVEFGVIGANATEMGNISMSAKGNLTVGLIGVDTPLITKAGVIALTSTDGKVAFADTLSVDTKVSTGLNISMTAKTTIGNAAGNATAIAAITNTGGNINATLAGDAKATINFTAVTKGAVSLNASNKGGLVSTLTQAGTIGDESVSTVKLGIAKSGESNALTVTGIVDTLNITGGSGKDVVVLATAQSLKSGTIALGAGADVLSFAGTTGGTGQGIAINLGSTTVTFSDTGSTTVAAGKAVGFLSTSTSSKVVTGNNGFELTVSGISEVVGTGLADHIVANAEGTKITGGAGGDTIVLGAGKDSIIYGGTDAATFKTEIGTNFNDTISNFTKGTDTISFAAATITAVAAVSAAAFNAITGITAALNDSKINFIKNAAFSAGDFESTTVIAGLFTSGITVAAADANDEIIFAITNGTDTFMYLYNGSASTGGVGTDGTIDASEIFLIAKLVGVNDMVAGDFIIV